MLNLEKYRNAPESFVDRMLLRYRIAEDGCWYWTGSRTRDGYGQANYKTPGRQFSVYPHVLAFQAWRGPLIEGHQIDHTCHDPATCNETDRCLHRRCINPAHLAQVLPWENAKRSTSPVAANVTKTTCPQGHPYDSLEGTTRRCSTCRADAKRRDYERNGSAANARRAEKMRTDPEYRERRLAAQRARSASEASAANRRARYAEDAEYRERVKAAVKKRYDAKKRGDAQWSQAEQ